MAGLGPAIHVDPRVKPAGDDDENDPLTNASMAKKKTSTRSKFFAKIGTRGWRDSGYDTFTYDSPALRRWVMRSSASTCRPRG